MLGDYEPDPARLERIRAARERAREGYADLQPHLDYLAAVSDVLGPSGYLVEEICQVGFASYFGYPVREPRHFITAGGQGTLGFGVPTALGVKAARRSEPVVALAGDGGFMFGVQELATAVQHRLGVVFVLFDNNAYGNVKADQQRLYGRPAGSDLTNPDFVALARSFGADAYSVTDPCRTAAGAGRGAVQGPSGRHPRPDAAGPVELTVAVHHARVAPAGRLRPVTGRQVGSCAPKAAVVSAALCDYLP